MEMRGLESRQSPGSVAFGDQISSISLGKPRFGTTCANFLKDRSSSNVLSVTDECLIAATTVERQQTIGPEPRIRHGVLSGHETGWHQASVCSLWTQFSIIKQVTRFACNERR